MDKKKILVVDDEAAFCRALKRGLVALGHFEVETAHDGKSGLEKAKRTKPDLILLDLLMPGLNGLQVLERLKQDAETMEIPVVMLTAQDDDTARARAAESFGELYLTKPVDLMELKFKIDQVLKWKG